MVRHLTAFCIRRRKTVLAVWLLVLLSGFAASPLLFGRLGSDVGTAGGSESAQVEQLLDRESPSGDEIFALIDGRSAADPLLRRDVEAAAADVRRIPAVAAVTTPWSPGGSALIATDGLAVAMRVDFSPDRPHAGEVDASATRLRAIDAPRVLVGGGPLQDDEMDEQAAADLARAETLSMPVVLVLLLVIFGSALAAGLPLVLALVGVAATLLGLAAMSLVLDVSVYSVNIVTMLGLGLAVDYALLIVSRFREERADGDALPDAIERTMTSAGRTVLFSGLTVAASLGSLLVFPDDFLRSMGVAGLMVVLLDMLAALTLLPALLALVGGRIRPRRARWLGRREERESGTGFVRVARAVRRYPVLILVSVTVVLVVPALPFLGARFADPDVRSLPSAAPSRQLAETAEQRFGLSEQTDPIDVVLDRPLDASGTAAVVAGLQERTGVESVRVRGDVPGRTALQVVPQGARQGEVAQRLVREIRRDAAHGPVGVQVGGDAAELVDYTAALKDRLPFAVALLLATTFALLFLFTGSVVVPLKAIGLNLLSLGAGLGALVWVFQEGHLGGLVGTEALGSLSITTPVLVFAIAFGLSMDYEVFLLGRITEEYRRTGDTDGTDRAVERGLQRTGGVVTAAALLVVVVFSGFVAGGFSPIKQVGLGLVLTVAIDATLVRMLLLPAAMTLLGRANWWAPAPLRRLHQRVGIVEGEPVLPPQRHVDAVSFPLSRTGAAD